MTRTVGPPRTDASDPAGAFETFASARREMPLVIGLAAAHPAPGPLAGRTVAACLHLTPETAVLVEALRGLGARVSLCAANPLSAQDGVVSYLQKIPGVNVVVGQPDWAGYRSAVEAVAAEGADLVIDDGADLTMALHAVGAGLLGGCENTSTGALRLASAASRHRLRVPIYAVSRGAAKRLYDDRHGTGQSVVDALLRTTNLLLAGRVAVVAGHGPCGRGIAARLAGMGARVVVTEISPQAALEAVLAGYAVAPMAEAIASADLVVTATGSRDVVTAEHLARAKDGLVLANAGHFDVEIDAAWLRSLGPGERQRPGLVAYRLPDGRQLMLAADGRVVNLAAADGHPPTVMDITFTTAVLCLLDLVARAGSGGSSEPGVYAVPEHIETQIAELALRHADVVLDVPSQQQVAYLQGWSGAVPHSAGRDQPE